MLSFAMFDTLSFVGRHFFQRHGWIGTFVPSKGLRDKVRFKDDLWEMRKEQSGEYLDRAEVKKNERREIAIAEARGCSKSARKWIREGDNQHQEEGTCCVEHKCCKEEGGMGIVNLFGTALNACYLDYLGISVGRIHSQ